MADIAREVDRAAAAIRLRWSETPRVAIILGSGLGGLAERIIDPVAIEYGELPHFPMSTAIGHAGRFVCGWLRGFPVIAMQGRFHAYEGHPLERVAFPVRVMRALGAEMLIVSNAAGGIHPHYQVGDVMVIDDHLNLIQKGDILLYQREMPAGQAAAAKKLNVPFYDRELANRALAIARRDAFPCHRGVYVAMLGPTYETRAEYRMVRRLGGDVVGMSTVPEVIVAVQLGMRVLGLSTVTNACSPDQLGETSGEQVIAAAAGASEKLLAIVEGVIAGIEV